MVNGFAAVDLPGYFESFTKMDGRTLQLTNIEGFDRLAIKKKNGMKIKDGQFIVYSDN